MNRRCDVLTVVAGVAGITAARGDWSADEFSQGTWVLDTDHVAETVPSMQKHGRVSFAGGDIARGFSSRMDGAIESGSLTAGEVRAAFT